MTASATKSWWQYARWTWLIARNMRITNPTGAELTAVRTFLKLIWNPMTQTGTRDWLQGPFQQQAVQVPGDTDYQCDIDIQPAHVIVELLGIVGRNLDNPPLTTVEAGYVDTLIAATGNRRYGTGPEFGGVGGSLVSIP